jgi:hypothetical protein
LYAVSRAGKMRKVLHTAAPLYLEDIAPDGRVLLQRQDRRYEVAFGRVGGQPRLLSWAAIMTAAAISRDGQYVLLTDLGSEENYQIYLAKLDGSPAVLLGKGSAGGISPDNKWVTSIPPNDTTKVMLLPTGVGDAKTITAPHFHYQYATWTSDGSSLVEAASESDRPVRFWSQKTDGSAPRPLTPEGIVGHFVTVNHSDYICFQDETGAVLLYPIDGSEPKRLRGFTQTDQVTGGSADSEDLYVSSSISPVSYQITKVNASSGRRQPFVIVSPTDGAGVTFVGSPIFARDENFYVYGQVRELSVLYVADGVK